MNGQINVLEEIANWSTMERMISYDRIVSFSKTRGILPGEANILKAIEILVQQSVLEKTINLSNEELNETFQEYKTFAGSSAYLQMVTEELHFQIKRRANYLCRPRLEI